MICMQRFFISHILCLQLASSGNIRHLIWICVKCALLQSPIAFLAGIGSYFLPSLIAGPPLAICHLLYEMQSRVGVVHSPSR